MRASYNIVVIRRAVRVLVWRELDGAVRMAQNVWTMPFTPWQVLRVTSPEDCMVAPPDILGSSETFGILSIRELDVDIAVRRTANKQTNSYHTATYYCA